MRLNQFLAQTMGTSRRKADDLIARGYVELDGDIAQFHNQVDKGNQIRIFQKGEWVSLTSPKDTETILFYKPIFSLTTRKDEYGRKTIYHHIPKRYHELKPAGRLDYMSEGLLVLSNDGDLIHTLTHPKNDSDKEYLVGLKYPIKQAEIREMEYGMVLEDYKLQPVTVEVLSRPDNPSSGNWNYLKLDPKLFWYRFTLHEGRNNQIRKMCEQFGQKVIRLIRIKHGNYQLTKELWLNKILEVK